MRILPLTLLLTAVTVLGQEKPAEKGPLPVQEKPAEKGPLPVQGPPPKNLTKQPDGHFSANSEPKNPENHELHVVVIGETLSGVSRDVLKDGRLWPQIWEQNEHIVNPHWIYPNDKILIRSVTRISEATPPAPGADEGPVDTSTSEQPAGPERARLVVSPAMAPPPPPGPRSIFNLTPPTSFPEVKAGDVNCAGFIRAESVPRDIKVVARYSDGQELAAAYDYIYLSRGLDDGVRPGTTYQALRPTKSVDGLGTHYLEIAQVQIVIGQPGYSLGRIVQGCDTVELGDILVPYTKTEFPALPSKRPFSGTMKGSGQIPGKIATTKIDMMNSGSRFSSGATTRQAKGSLKLLNRGIEAEGGVVYLDVGRDEGVKLGDFFIVFRDVPVKDGVLRDDGEKARTAIAELVILKVEERASTALVTYSDDAIGQGDAVERR
jgi:hypothetical protein